LQPSFRQAGKFPYGVAHDARGDDPGFHDYGHVLLARAVPLLVIALALLWGAVVIQ
jgi:hypothetical protein